MAEEWYVVGPGIQQDTTAQGVRLYIQYKCTWNNCNGVNVRWDYYDSSTSSWIYGNTSTEAKETTVYYDVPQNVTQARVELVPQPTMINGAPAFGGGNITHVFNVGDWTIPGKGDAPEISISKDIELKLVLDNIAQTPTPVEGVMFEVYKKEHNEQQGRLYQKVNAAVYNGHAEATVTVTYGAEFTAKSVYYNHRNNFDSDGFPTNGTASDPTQPIKSAPLPVEGFGITYQIISAGAMLNLTMTWTENVDANEYEIQYTNYDYDWALVEKVQSITTDQHSYILQLQNGGHYRFRIRAKNDAGNSSWYETDKSFGLAPLAPTTWTDVTRKLNDGSFTLYWKHNSRDSTREIKAELVIRPENEPEKTITVSRQNQDEKDWYKNNIYELDTRFYLTSTTVFWKVRTCGESGEYGEWSIEKEIQIYAQPGIQSWLQNDTTYINYPLGVTTATQYPFTICSRLFEAIEPYHKSKLLFKDGYIDESDATWPIADGMKTYPSYKATSTLDGGLVWDDSAVDYSYDDCSYSAFIKVTPGVTYTLGISSYTAPTRPTKTLSIGYGSQTVSIDLIAGHSYGLTNNADNSIAAWTSIGGNNVDTITGGLNPGQGATFTPSANCDGISLWSNGAGSIEVHDMTPVVNGCYINEYSSAGWTSGSYVKTTHVTSSTNTWTCPNGTEYVVLSFHTNAKNAITFTATGAPGNFVLPLQKYPYMLTVQTTGLPAWADIRIIFYDFAGRKVNASSWSSTDGVWLNVYEAQQFSAEVRVTDGQTHTRQELSNLVTFIVTSDTNITQKLTEYVLNIKAVNDHTASDLTLNDVSVKAGDIVYSRNIPITEDSVTTTLQNEISIDDVMLTKNQQYKYELTAWFVSGASATSVGTFTFAPNSAATVNYEVEVYGIYNQEEKSYKLYVDVENDDLDKNFKVYVFRREHDYTYTTVVDGITGFSGYVIDSHPRLDKSMYFVSVIGKSSGKRWNIVHQDKEYTQLFPVIQWGKSLYPEINPTTYELKLNQDELIELLYNIDVNETRSRTSETSVYAGRVDPVSYYGESLSNSQTWNCEIPADDYKTLDKLRVLSTHNGPCYVRTPKGENYWSNIGVTITNTHNEVIRKVSLTITKVWSDKP